MGLHHLLGHLDVRCYRSFALCWLIDTIFFSHNGAVAAAVFQAWRASGGNSTQPIALPSSDPDSDPNNDPDKPSGEASDNPLAAVDVPKLALIVIFGSSIVGSIAAAFIFMVSILSHLPLLDGPGAEIIHY